ncbi:VOC family protein [Fulvivirgaceae bacterium PWU4]|uniref:VOC family protein n=1 Tax=Chryseosolibacter histidini TaxID=2782349 RepID=A0AAP2GNN5_9BACT|nr:VOC family protein [Chryseosolibacter histidini]MBT1696697.1 VOC family protein [Chryseosolibacter histidini]
MKPKITVITLGVNDLRKSFAFYKEGMGFPSKDGIQGDGDLQIAFFQLEGTWLSLFEKEKLAKDGNTKNDGTGFPGFSLGHMVKTPQEVDQIIAQAVTAGATVSDPPHRRDWGGYSGYIKDLDGYYWEIAFMDNPFPNV